ncbi:MAG: TolC family protein [Muribaculaceae bacterium]|nr:TolC family protein [Muribaculaceae bacterium]
MRKSSAISLLLAALTAGAQTPWSLEQCVDHAVSHNLTVKARELESESARLTLTEAKDRVLPTLDASASQTWNFGRGLTASNTYADRNTSNFQWGVGLSLPLFQGLSAVRRIKASESSLAQTLTETAAAKDDIALNVVAQYLQVLYSREVEQSAASQVEYTAYEVGRQQALVEQGKVPEADLYDAQAQHAQDKLQLVAARNDTRTALVQLANLLQLPTAEGFDVLPLSDSEPIIPGPDQVYNEALGINHSLMAARQGIEAARDNISLAKTGYIPRIDFNAGIGSSYYKVSDYPNEAFGAQMRHNYATYLGFRLTVPIFDGFSTRNQIRRARLSKLQAELELDRRESELYKEIQLAYYQAEGARERYLASGETLEKMRLSFEATREKYNLGRSTPAEFEQAKNNLFRTEVSSIQARYEYLLRCRILSFYRTNRL